MEPVMFGSILTASLLGSVHCAGMCGGLVALYAGRDTGRSEASLHVAYNLGRLTVYLALGAVAGLVGAGLNLAGATFRLQNAAALAGGTWMIGWGVQSLARQLGISPGIPNPLARLQVRLLPLYRQLHGRPGSSSAYAIGLLSGLLPCGWLYLFVGSAAGSGHALTGAAMMGVFWLGTLPALASLGLLVRRLTGPVRRALPAVAAVLLVIGGLYTVGTRLSGRQAKFAAFEQGTAGSLSPGAHSCEMHQP